MDIKIIKVFIILIFKTAHIFPVINNHQLCTTKPLYFEEEGETTTEIILQENENYDYAEPLPHLPKGISYFTTCSSVKLPLASLNSGLEQEQYDIFLEIIRSNITTIPTSAFVGCNEIKRLYMENVNIENIEPGAFNGLQKLSNLSLKNNEIETITKGIFNSLNSLESLDLSSNRIQLIESKSFVGLNNLTELLLNNNELANLESNLFENLNHLEYLDLSNNLLKEVDLKFLNLKELNIAENQLKTFEINLVHLPIIYLNLSNNEISSINVLLFPPFIDQLDLSNNNLIYLENCELLFCSNINLNYNQLENIGGINGVYRIFRANNNNLTNLDSISKFNTITLLIELDVGFNKIKKLNRNVFDNFRNLEKLYLHHNQINKIESSCFRHLNKLVILDLSSNQLNYLPYGLFGELTNLQILNLSYNYLTNFNRFSLNPTLHLQQLYLDHNLIKSLYSKDEPSLYLMGLNQISLDGNKFYCKDLAKLFDFFTIKKVKLLEGTVFNQENIKGIPCYTDVNNYENTNSDIVSHFYNTSFYRFFQIDFQKSNFYKFFKSYPNNNANLTIEKTGNFDYLSRFEDSGNNFQRDPVIIGLFVFFAIIVFLLTINLYWKKRN